MKRLTAFGCALVALSLVALLVYAPGPDSPDDPWLKAVFVGVLVAAAAIYLASVRLVLRRALPPRIVWIVLAAALAMRAGPLLAPAFLSSDIYRYVWDGRVQAAGINPYRYIPADPALTALRDAAIFPHINRADTAPTIYAPAAQIVFAVMGRLSQTVLAVKFAMLGFEILAVLCLLALLRAARLPPERVLIYAWNPLAVWEFAGNGHVDAAAIGLLAAALLLRARRRDGIAGMVFGAAVLIKFLPAIAAPALWRAGRGWRLAGAALLTTIALYALYGSVGTRVFGFLSGYGGEEGLSDGSGIWLLAAIGAAVPLPAAAGIAYLAVIGALLAGLGAWCAFRRRPQAGSAADIVRICADAAVLMACATAAISPHYPWYFPWLALPCVIAPIPAAIWLSAAPVLLYLDMLDSRIALPALIYLPAAVLAWRDLARHLRRPTPIALEGSI